MSDHFADRLAAAIDRAGAPACVGLDPVYEKLPATLRESSPPPRQIDAIERFCEGVLDACAGVVPAVKPQSACFERHGPAGFACLARVCARARELGFVVVLDAKRGDIGVSAEHYAAAAFGPAAFHADAVTVSPYLGPDTIEPFLALHGTGVFVLVRTSNPGSDAVQSARLADGRSVAEMIAGQVAGLGATRVGARGLSSVGAVVGATKAADAAALRAIMPDAVFLVPGYGAQGGTAGDIRGMLRPRRSGPGDAGVLVTASRSVIYPPARAGALEDWRGAIAAAARSLVAELAGVLA